MAASDVKVGPWGGKGGKNPWTYKPNGSITGFRIRSGGVVDSIRFTYTDSDNVTHHSETYGGDGGSGDENTFDDGESIIAISGTVGEYGDATVITSISFETTKKTYGPYGTEWPTTFSLPVTKGQFVGFIGNYGLVLDSFGAILDSN